MGWSGRHSPVLLAHVTQAAAPPQRATPPPVPWVSSSPSGQPYRKPHPSRVQMRKPGLREVKSLASGHRARTRGPMSRLLNRKNIPFYPTPRRLRPTGKTFCCVTLDEWSHLSEPVF